MKSTTRKRLELAGGIAVWALVAFGCDNPREQCRQSSRRTARAGRHFWERGRPARILSHWPWLSFSAMQQAATLSGNRIGPWRRCHCPSGGDGEAAGGFVPGRPRSQEAIIP